MPVISMDQYAFNDAWADRPGSGNPRQKPLTPFEGGDQWMVKARMASAELLVALQKSDMKDYDHYIGTHVPFLTTFNKMFERMGEENV
tara:strand:- start:857 stop:1120 length:264 start_codon:yes stop_codon:yes gene_type:complete